MAFRKTVQDAKNDIGLGQISGVDSESPEFLALLNEVEEALMIRGGWFDLEQRFTFCLSGTHVVWPEFVGTILAIRFCRGGTGVSKNGWFSFSGFSRPGCGFGGDGFNAGLGWNNRGDVVIEDANQRPCYNEVSGGSGRLIRYCTTNPRDAGKTITIFGKKFGGQPLQERKDGGSLVMGTTLVATNPYAQTTDMVTEITSIIREPTESMAYLYEYDPECDTLRDIAAFRPQETRPRYRCSRILNIPRRTPDSNGCCWTPIEALVKLKFIELKCDRDFLPVDNFRAVKLAIQAVKQEENGNDEAALAKWTLAIHEMNMESFDKLPDDQIVFENATFGRAGQPHRRLY